MNQKLKPMIYFACLTAYNAGHVHGQWLDAARKPVEIQDDIRSILASSPVASSEDYAIHDYEGFGAIRIHENYSIPEVSGLALLIEEHGEAFTAYASHVGNEYATELSFQDAYHGHWESERAYAEHLFDEIYAYEVPENLRFYIDYEAFTRDLFLNGYFSIPSSDHCVHVFCG